MQMEIKEQVKVTTQEAREICVNRYTTTQELV